MTKFRIYNFPIYLRAIPVHFVLFLNNTQSFIFCSIKIAQPRKPTIITENTIISGTVQTFTCSTTSTSNPAPGLPLTYSWFVNYAPVNNPRFSVTGNGGQTLTIDRVQKQDKGTTLRCVANEDKGLTSEHSDLKTLDVLCKKHRKILVKWLNMTIIIFFLLFFMNLRFWCVFQVNTVFN